jgi:septal ring-binding cell division protein DamX
MANKKSPPEKPKKRHVLEFSLTSLLFSGIGFIFILVWVFALGIMVGRGFLPRSMEGFWFFKGKAVSHEKGNKAKQVPLIKEEELTFYNQLTDKKSKAKSEAPRQAPPKDQVSPPKRAKIAQEGTDKAGNYRVQVAALKDKGQTEEMVERLIKSGYPAYYYKTLIKGTVYYRIRCGPYTTVDQAKSLAARLIEKEGFKPFIVYPDNE